MGDVFVALFGAWLVLLRPTTFVAPNYYICRLIHGCFCPLSSIFHHKDIDKYLVFGVGLGVQVSLD